MPTPGRVAVSANPNIEIWDINPDLNAQFFALYDSLLKGRPFDEAAFRDAAASCFEASHAAGQGPDPFFDNFGPLGLPWPDTRLRFTHLWEWALAVARDWEATTGRRIHKGTGYYFACVRDIELGDLDRGFLYLHQAAEEDAITTGSVLPPPSPATWFITLDGRRLDLSSVDCSGHQ